MSRQSTNTRPHKFGLILISISLLVLLIAPRLTTGQGSQTLYVSPDGNDANSGTVAQPLATFTGARDRVRTLLAATDDDIIVNFRGGTYAFTETVTLGAQDSGSVSQSVTYQRYQNETPIFSSLVPVTGWTTYSGNIMRAPLPNGLGQIRYLQDASETWLPRSATNSFQPAESSAANEAVVFDSSSQEAKMSTQYPTGWGAPNSADASQYDLRVTAESWSLNILPMTQIDTAQRRIHVGIPGTYQLKSCSSDCTAAEAWVLNSIEGIDTPGEWAVVNGQIYFYPISGTDDIFAPRLQELIRIDAGGDGNTWNGTPIQHITFDGITFTGGDFYMRKWNRNNQADQALTDRMAMHDWHIVDAPAGMVEIRNATNITIRNATFTKSGGGLRLDRYAQNITITNNTFSYLGREGILLAGRGPGYGDVNRDNTISYNQFQSTGREMWDAPAIGLTQSSNNKIHHNFITDTHFSGYMFTSSRGIYLANVAVEGLFSSGYLGTESYIYEIAPHVLEFFQDPPPPLNEADTPIASHQFLYNYNNIFEKNVLTNLHNGDQFYSQPNVALSNGTLYSSGGSYADTTRQTNYVRLNYFYDVTPFDTQLHYQDDYTHNINIEKNLIYNYRLNVPDEGALWDMYLWDNLTPPEYQVTTGSGIVQSNAVMNSTYDIYVGGVERGNLAVQGNLDLSSGDPAWQGSADYLNDYIEMYNLLCDVPMIVPTDVTPSGVAQFKSGLGAKITALGGTVPTCSGTDPTPIPTTAPTPASTPSSSWIFVDDRDSTVIYSGTWTDLAIESAAEGTVKWGTEAGAQASFTFTGSSVQVYIWRYDEEQTFNILLDGQFVTAVTVPAGSEGSFMAWESPSVRAVTRTVTVEVGDSELHLDRFAYQSVPTVATLSQQAVQPNQVGMLGTVLIGLVAFGGVLFMQRGSSVK